jgi:hypothetical protein
MAAFSSFVSIALCTTKFSSDWVVSILLLSWLLPFLSGITKSIFLQKVIYLNTAVDNHQPLKTPTCSAYRGYKNFR